jgi:hypothetical protein
LAVIVDKAKHGGFYVVSELDFFCF